MKFGDTKTCTIDCRDDYRGARPPLGYETFRKIWHEGIRSEQIPIRDAPKPPKVPRPAPVSERVVFSD